MWNFEKKGVIKIFNFPPAREDKQFSIFNYKSLGEFELELIDEGAEDIKNEEEGIIIITNIDGLQKIKEFLENKRIAVESADVEFVAKDELVLGEDARETLEKFIEELEENEDVSDYYTNVNI
jgi:transcriptional/translational regulatory protein YebC/TACO1